MSHISNDKWEKLKKKMKILGILEENITEKFILGSGSGGQKVNKTHSAVQLNYKNHMITCKKYRERDLNRYESRKALCEKVQDEMGIKSKLAQRIEKKIKQKKRRKKKAVNKYNFEDNKNNTSQD